jgi:hypothetical protein
MQYEGASTQAELNNILAYIKAALEEAASTLASAESSDNPDDAPPDNLLPTTPSPALTRLANIRTGAANQDLLFMTNPHIATLSDALSGLGSEGVERLKTFLQGGSSSREFGSSSRSDGGTRSPRQDARSRSASPSPGRSPVAYSADKSLFWYVNNAGERVSPKMEFSRLESMAGKTRDEVCFEVILSVLHGSPSSMRFCQGSGADHSDCNSVAHREPYPGFAQQVATHYARVDPAHPLFNRERHFQRPAREGGASASTSPTNSKKKRF